MAALWLSKATLRPARSRLPWPGCPAGTDGVKRLHRAQIGKSRPHFWCGLLESGLKLALLRWGRGISFAFLAGLRLWLRFGCLLDFFSAFVFASHGCKCAIKGRPGERQRGNFSFKFQFLNRIQTPVRHSEFPLTPGSDSGILKSLRGVAPGVCVHSPGPGWLIG